MKFKTFAFKFPSLIIVLLTWIGVLILTSVKLYVTNEQQNHEIDHIKSEVDYLDSKTDFNSTGVANLTGRFDEFSRSCR